MQELDTRNRAHITDLKQLVTMSEQQNQLVQHLILILSQLKLYLITFKTLPMYLLVDK